MASTLHRPASRQVRRGVHADGLQHRAPRGHRADGHLHRHGQRRHARRRGAGDGHRQPANRRSSTSRTSTQQRVFDAGGHRGHPGRPQPHQHSSCSFPACRPNSRAAARSRTWAAPTTCQNTTFTIHGSKQQDTRLQLDGVRVGNVLIGRRSSRTTFPTRASTAGSHGGRSGACRPSSHSAVCASTSSRARAATRCAARSSPRVSPPTWQSDQHRRTICGSEGAARTRTALKQAYDINPSGGRCRILRDQLWFYISARFQANQNYVAGLYRRTAMPGDASRRGCPIRTPRSLACSSVNQKGGNGRVSPISWLHRSTSSRSTTTTRAASGTTAVRRSPPSPRWRSGYPCSHLGAGAVAPAR